MKAENKKEAQKNFKYFDTDPNKLIELSKGEGIITGLHKNGFKIKIIPLWERN